MGALSLSLVNSGDPSASRGVSKQLQGLSLCFKKKENSYLETQKSHDEKLGSDAKQTALGGGGKLGRDVTGDYGR